MWFFRTFAFRNCNRGLEEFDINLLTTTPGVVYKIHMNSGSKDFESSSLPDPTLIKFIEEPWIKATIITPVNI